MRLEFPSSTEPTALSRDASRSAGTIAAARVRSIDIIRGAIMALMALDHTRMYLSAATFDPLAVGKTNLAYFTTRWVTHLCAPGFFFLAGLSVHLSQTRGADLRSSSVLLAVRGVWLIILELTVLGFAWSLTPGWSWFGVIWCLGASMLCLSLLQWAPRAVLGVVSATFLLAHNFLPMTAIIPSKGLLGLLYSADSFAGREVVFPLLPWLAIMVLGYAAGPWLTPRGKPVVPRLAGSGVVLLAAFLIFRIAGWGQPAAGGMRRWPNWTDTLMSSLNVEKYPPSTQYVLVTLGLLALATALVSVLELRRPRIFGFLAPLWTFGRVPLFFYVLHLYLIHGLCLLIAYALHWPTGWLFWHEEPDLVPPHGYGASLGGVYITWLAVLLLLLPCCAAFGRAKQRSNALWTKLL